MEENRDGMESLELLISKNISGSMFSTLFIQVFLAFPYFVSCFLSFVVFGCIWVSALVGGWQNEIGEESECTCIQI